MYIAREKEFKQKMKKFYSVSQWILGILTALVGIGNMTTTFFSGALITIAGLLVIPKIRRVILPSKYVHRAVKILFPIALLLAAFVFDSTRPSKALLIVKAVKEFAKTNQGNLAIQNAQFLKEGERLFFVPASEYNNDWEVFDIDTTAIELVTTGKEYHIIVKPKLRPNGMNMILPDNYLNLPDTLKGFSTYSIKFILDSSLNVERALAIYETINKSVISSFEDSTLVLSNYANDEALSKMNELMNHYQEKKRLEKEEVKAKEERKEHFESECLSDWDGSCPDLVEKVKGVLNDPKSFQHVETRYIIQENSYYIEMKFRAKNSYGALILNVSTALVDENCKVLSYEIK